MTPDARAFVLTSSNERGGVPSAKMRFPVPNKTGKTTSRTSSASPCSSSVDVSVELPERITSGLSCALMRRMPSTMSDPRVSAGPHAKTFRTVGSDIFCCRIEAVRHRTARRLWPEARPHIVGATTKQQTEALDIRGEDLFSASGGPIGRGPVAVGKIVFIGGLLNHAVQRDLFDDPDLSHSVSLNTGFCSPVAGAVNTIPMGCSTEKTGAPRRTPGRRRRPYVSTSVPRPCQRLALSKDRLCAPWSPGMARR